MFQSNKEDICIFIASPGDCLNERIAAENVIKKIGKKYKENLKAIRWENDIVPLPGRTQQIILDQGQIEECSVLIGIFRSRFGTPTEKAGSGTQEEIETAYKSWIEKASPNILLYFQNCQNHQNECSNQSDSSNQTKKLRVFQKSIINKIFSREYKEIEEFKTLLFTHLKKTIIEPRRICFNCQKVDGINYKELYRVGRLCPGFTCRHLIKRLDFVQDPMERQWIFLTLGEIGGPLAQPILENAINDTNEHVFSKMAAERALIICERRNKDVLWGKESLSI